MTRSPSSLIVMIAVLVAALGSMALGAQDKYTVKVPNGLAVAEFRGYEDWQDVAVSQTENGIKAIVANPVMINAYREGLPPMASLSPTVRSAKCGYACHAGVAAKDYIFTAYPKR